MPDKGDTKAGGSTGLKDGASTRGTSSGGSSSRGPGGPNGPNSGPSRGGGSSSGGGRADRDQQGGGGGLGGGNKGGIGGGGRADRDQQGGGSNRGGGGGLGGGNKGAGPGGPSGPNSGPSRGGGGGQSTAGGKTDLGGRVSGNVSKVGGPGAGGMGAGNARNGSSTTPVGMGNGYSALGNIGRGPNPAGGLNPGTSRAIAESMDRLDGLRQQMDNFVSRNPQMDMTRSLPGSLAQQYSQYRSPPGMMMDPREGGRIANEATRARQPLGPDDFRAPAQLNDVSRLGMGPDDFRAPSGFGSARDVRVAQDVARDAFRQMAERNAPLGPDDFRRPGDMMSPQAVQEAMRLARDYSISRQPLGPDDFRAPPGARPVASNVDLYGEDVAMDPSLPGRQAASKYAYDKYNLRGITGPYGEPRQQPTSYGTNYQTAQMARMDYPKELGRYDQTRLTNALDKISKALPGEADINRYGDVANVMNDLARVSLNQMVGGFRPEKAVAALDTTGLRPATRGFANPGPNSMGMTDRWKDKELGLAQQARAAQAIQDALQGRGVNPQAANASNFVAAGTRLPSGVAPIGKPINGSQFGRDTTWGNRISNRNTAAGRNSLTSGSSDPMSNGYADGRGTARTPQESARNTSATGPDDFRNPGGMSNTYPAAGSNEGQTYTKVQGGLGITAFNETPYEGFPGVEGGYGQTALNEVTRPFTSFSGDAISNKNRRDNSIYGGVYGKAAPLGADDFRAPPRPSGRGPDDFRAPGTGNIRPASAEDETVLSVEDVPLEDNPPPPAGVAPSYISPTTQMPAYPEKTRVQKFLERAPYVGGFLKGMSWLGHREWDNMTPEQQAALQQKWAENNHDYLRNGNLGGSRNEDRRPAQPINAYIPPPAAPPPPDDPTPDPDGGNDPWGNQQFLGYAPDPYNYGYGPGFNYFYYG